MPCYNEAYFFKKAMTKTVWSVYFQRVGGR